MAGKRRQDCARRLSILRWMDVLAVVVVGFSVCVVMAPVLNTISDRVGEVVGAVRHWVIAYVMVLALAGGAWFSLIRLGGFRLADMWPPNLLRYPPVWVGAVVAAVAYAREVPLEGGALHQDGAWLIGMLALGPVFAAGLDKLWRSRGSRGVDQSTPPERGDRRVGICALLEDPQRLIQWLQEEKPIVDPTDDLSGISGIARRIERLVRESPLKTIGVVGPYGSGKTSLLRLVNHYLRSDSERGLPSETLFPRDRVIICDVGSWGFREGSAAEHVLKAVVEELSHHVDCLGLAGLPSAYRAALADTGSTWGRLVATCAIRSHDPIAILKKMDRVLACIRRRLVVYLEDIDRNVGDEVLSQEISALLDRLKDLKHLSFVLSIAGEATPAVARICEHTEMIPKLPPRDVLRLLLAFRGHCFETGRSGGDIDPVSDDNRESRLGLERCLTFVDYFSPVLVRGEPALSIQRLLATPRAAKSALRRIWQAWQSLHGELDFEDLLAATVLRVAAPEAFWFLLHHAEQLRGVRAMESAPGDTREAVRTDLRQRWTDATREVPWDTEAADTLVNFLFPGWKESRGPIAGPQGVRHAEPVDYWVRLNAEEVPDQELRDQAVLRALPKWRDSPAAQVYGKMDLPTCILRVGGFDAKVLQFGPGFFQDGEEVRDLAHQLFELIREGKGIRRYWRRFEDMPEYPGFYDLSRLALKRSIQEGHDAWILEEIRLTLPVNLRLATELYQFLRFASEQEEGRKDQKPELRRYMRAEVQKLFANDPEALMRALEPDRHFIYTVRDFAIQLGERPPDGQPFDPEEWAWLARALLRVAEIDPQLAIPQIVGLLWKVPETSLGPHFADKYDERANKLFGSEIERAKALLAREIEASKFTEQDKRQIEYARDWARSHLSV